MAALTWKSYGACVDSGIDFFPDPKLGRFGARPAKDCCAACFVRGQCLDYALAHDELGIWGGTNESERKWIRARYIRPKNVPPAFKALDQSAALG